MITISISQARQRSKTLPEILREALFSVHISETIDRISQENYLPDDRIEKVAEVVGYVILGFLHIEEVPKELQERAGLPKELCAAIAKSLESRIFNPLRAEIEKVYAPVPHITEELPGQVVQEIKAIAPQTIQLSPSGEPLTPFDAPLKDRITFKIDSLGGGKGGEPAPVIIHQEQNAVPISAAPRFDLKLSRDKLAEAGSEIKAPLRPAELEARGLKKEEKKTYVPAQLPKIPMEMKFVRYGQFEPAGDKGKTAPAPISALPLEDKEQKTPFWGRFKNVFSSAGTRVSENGVQGAAIPPEPKPAISSTGGKQLRYPIPPKVGKGTEIPPVPISGFKKISIPVPDFAKQPPASQMSAAPGKKEGERLSPLQFERKTEAAAPVRVVDFNEKGTAIETPKNISASGRQIAPATAVKPVPPKIPVSAAKDSGVKPPEASKIDVRITPAKSPADTGGERKKKWFSFLNFFSGKASPAHIEKAVVPVSFSAGAAATLKKEGAVIGETQKSAGGKEKVPKTDPAPRKFPIPPKVGGSG